MQAVLYIGHGSRIKAGVEEAIRFIENCKEKIHAPIQDICFLELAKPSILEGITKCIERGATKITIVPILLLTAAHAKKDIPAEIEKGRIMYPQVQFSYGRPLGIHEKIIDSLYDRIAEKDVKITSNAEVLLVGRGSSDPAVKRDLTRIAGLFQDKYRFQKVDVCFLYGAKPHFSEALQNLCKSASKQVFIIPYLLFTGILMNDIEKQIRALADDGKQLVLCESLGYHPHIQDVLLERVNELIH